jgi:hypothetical protein
MDSHRSGRRARFSRSNPAVYKMRIGSPVLRRASKRPGSRHAPDSGAVSRPGAQVHSRERVGTRLESPERFQAPRALAAEPPSEKVGRSGHRQRAAPVRQPTTACRRLPVLCRNVP